MATTAAIGFILTVMITGGHGVPQSIQQIGPFESEKLCDVAKDRLSKTYMAKYGPSAVDNMLIDCMQSNGQPLDSYLASTYHSQMANAATQAEYTNRFQANLNYPSALASEMEDDPNFFQFVRDWFGRTAEEDGTQAWNKLSDQQFLDQVIKPGKYLPEGYRSN